MFIVKVPVIFPLSSSHIIFQYLGRWRLIESYPSAFQLGACNRAEYSLNTDGTVIVYNTEVVNQTFSQATGVATLVLDANNQPIGKFQVTFPECKFGMIVMFKLQIIRFDLQYTNIKFKYRYIIFASKYFLRGDSYTINPKESWHHADGWSLNLSRNSYSINITNYHMLCLLNLVR